MSGAWNPVSLDQCPDCGYLLTGLPEQGICPECGLAYGPDLLVLYGWERKSKPSLVWALIGTVFVTMGAGWWLTSVALGFMLEFPLLQTMGLVRVMSYVQPLLVLLLVGLMVAATLRRHLGLPPVQVRITPAGLGQRNGIGPMKLTPWDPRIRVLVSLLPKGYCRIEARFVGFVPDKVRSEIVAVSVEGGGRVADAIERRVRRWQRSV